MRSWFKQEGAAAVELALLIGLLVVIVFGITEFGRAIYQYNTLAKSTRNATKFLSRQAAGPANDVEAINLAVYGNVAGTGSVLAPGLTTGMVSICDAVRCPTTHNNQSTGPTTGAVNLVTVTIGGVNAPYQFVSVVPFVVPDITFGPITTTMRQP